MRYKTPLKFRQYMQKRQRTLRVKLKKVGYHAKTMWFPTRLADLAAQRAGPMGISQQTVFMAAIEVGLRHLRTSDIIRTEAAWRNVCGLPPAPRYHGARFDPQWNFKKGERRRAKSA